MMFRAKLGISHRRLHVNLLLIGELLPSVFGITMGSASSVKSSKNQQPEEEKNSAGMASLSLLVNDMSISATGLLATQIFFKYTYHDQALITAV